MAQRCKEKSQVRGIESWVMYFCMCVRLVLRCKEKSQVRGIERSQSIVMSVSWDDGCKEKSQVRGIESKSSCQHSQVFSWLDARKNPK